MNLKFSKIDASDKSHLDALFQVYGAVPNYFQAVLGRAACWQDMIQDLEQGPPEGVPFEREFSGIWLEDALLGCTDVAYGYPDARTAYIGLLLLKEKYQAQGYGSCVLAQLSDSARQKSITKMRVAVITTNLQALIFWRHKGFQSVGVKPQKDYLGPAVIMESEI